MKHFQNEHHGTGTGVVGRVGPDSGGALADWHQEIERDHQGEELLGCGQKNNQSLEKKAKQSVNSPFIHIYTCLWFLEIKNLSFIYSKTYCL